MKACDLPDEVYNELCNLPYGRKVTSVDDPYVGKVVVSRLSEQARQSLKHFPIRPIVEENLMLIDDLNGEQQFYIMTLKDKNYLVDTQGYDYPRYIVKLEYEV